MADTAPTSRSEYETAQRETIMDVLLANGLVQEAGGVITITDVGRPYGEHLNSQLPDASLRPGDADDADDE